MGLPGSQSHSHNPQMTYEHNSVHLTGRLGRGAQHRELPSGDQIVAFTVVTPRTGKVTGPRVDAINCQVRTAVLRNRLLKMDVGTHIDVTGFLQRRFWRTNGGIGSVTEVVVTSVSRVTP
jgi:single-stranded DNA-binding protein